MEILSFYNVENLFSPDPTPTHKTNPTPSGLRNWDQRKYTDKLNKIARVFSMIKEEKGVLPFIIGLSEVSGIKVLEDLVSTAPFNNQYGIIHFPSMDERKVDVAILYDLSKIERVNATPYSFVFEIENSHPEAYDTTRDVLYAQLKYQEKIIHFYVAHLPSKREKDINLPKRNFILNEIRDKIETLSEEDPYVVFCGDFNENPDAENILQTQLSKKGERLLDNPFLALFQNKKYSTFHYKSGLLFDQILLSPAFSKKENGLHWKEASVFDHEKLKGKGNLYKDRPFRTFAGTRYLGGYSDHFPVYITLSATDNHS